MQKRNLGATTLVDSVFEMIDKLAEEEIEVQQTYPFSPPPAPLKIPKLTSPFIVVVKPLINPHCSNSFEKV